MDRQDGYRALESLFTATFISELIPGIIHNFANPLNGIMGRGQIMRRRFDQLMEKLRQTCPQAVLGHQDLFDKLSRDIEEVNNESDRCCQMFQDVSGKFYSLSTHDWGKFSLHQLITMELRFADYYLNFKHQIKKDVRLDDGIPPVSGHFAHCSLIVWAIMRQAMHDMLASPERTLTIRTIREEEGALISLEYPAAESPGGNTGATVADSPCPGDPVVRREENLLSLAERLLASMDSKLEIREENGRRYLNVRLKY